MCIVFLLIYYMYNLIFRFLHNYFLFLFQQTRNFFQFNIKLYYTEVFIENSRHLLSRLFFNIFKKCVWLSVSRVLHSSDNFNVADSNCCSDIQPILILPQKAATASAILA